MQRRPPASHPPSVTAFGNVNGNNGEALEISPPRADHDHDRQRIDPVRDAHREGCITSSSGGRRLALLIVQSLVFRSPSRSIAP